MSTACSPPAPRYIRRPAVALSLPAGSSSALVLLVFRRTSQPVFGRDLFVSPPPSLAALRQLSPPTERVSDRAEPNRLELN